LAFTGPGKGIAWTAELGALLIIVGQVLLVLVSDPRRIWGRLRHAGVLGNLPRRGHEPEIGAVRAAWVQSATTRIRWMLGR
jgi:hypothetical protein